MYVSVSLKYYWLDESKMTEMKMMYQTQARSKPKKLSKGIASTKAIGAKIARRKWKTQDSKTSEIQAQKPSEQNTVWSQREQSKLDVSAKVKKVKQARREC